MVGEDANVYSQNSLRKLANVPIVSNHPDRKP